MIEQLHLSPRGLDFGGEKAGHFINGYLHIAWRFHLHGSAKAVEQAVSFRNAPLEQRTRITIERTVPHSLLPSQSGFGAVSDVT
jgi:hypothetical protein